MTRRRMLRHNSIEAWETAQDRLEVLSPACPLMSEGGAGGGNPPALSPEAFAVVPAPDQFSEKT